MIDRKREEEKGSQQRRERKRQGGKGERGSEKERYIEKYRG